MNERNLTGSLIVYYTEIIDSINHNIVFEKRDSSGMKGPRLLLFGSYLFNLVQLLVFLVGFSKT